MSATHDSPPTQQSMETVAEPTILRLQFTKMNHRRGFADLPRELRDEIYIYALKSLKEGDIYAYLMRRPSKIYRSLSQVSRTVRSESADIYWPQKFPYYDSDLLSTRPPGSPDERKTLEADKPAFAFSPVYRSLDNRECLREARSVVQLLW